ncbi:nuclear transport factor 2 family protein [Halobacteriales archaeon QS_5_70_15]|nr:MAG: nuclear transport factor 2 family protein [Halobacteriales archaeon QS_5_70_15]
MTRSDSHPHVAVIERYLERLRNDDFEGAADQFTPDATYLHPPTFRDDVEAVGRDAILEYFRESRGTRDIDHAIERSVVDGDAVAVQGRMTGGDVDGGEVFVSYAEIEDGLMSYYCAGFLKGTIG